MDLTSIERINTLHPVIQDEVKSLYREANMALPKSMRLRITQAFRTPEEQNALYVQKPKVTNAQAWQSTHNYGLAFDICLLIDKDGDGKFETASWDRWSKEWLIVTNVFVKAGFENGFMKNGKKWDYPHFQKDFGYDWRGLKFKIDSGKYTVINNRKYPKI